jgi:Ca2+/H+ antiporter
MHNGSALPPLLPPWPKMHFVSPEFLFWFELALKMVVTALFVSVATVIAERLGPTVGALVATLPVSAGPVYVFLALVMTQPSFLQAQLRALP